MKVYPPPSTYLLYYHYPYYCNLFYITIFISISPPECLCFTPRQEDPKALKHTINIIINIFIITTRHFVAQSRRPAVRRWNSSPTTARVERYYYLFTISSSRTRAADRVSCVDEVFGGGFLTRSNFSVCLLRQVEGVSVIL